MFQQEHFTNPEKFKQQIMLEEIRSKAKAYLALPRDKFYLTEYKKIQDEEEAMLRLIRDSKNLDIDTKVVGEGEEIIKIGDKQINNPEL